jgi:hypothetical protein
VILFCVYVPQPGTRYAEHPTDVVVVLADGRESAKRAAHPHLLNNPDQYVVTPLTREGDRLTFAIAGAWIQT